MKTKSRALVLFLCLMLLVGLLPSTVLAADGPEAASFEDVQEGSWYYEDVDYVSSAGLMTGTSEDTFSPELAVTRGMFVTVLHRMEDEPEAEAAAFEDVDAEAYYAAAVAWAAENGIVTGYSDVMFGPTDTITREQAVTILYRYAIYKGLDAVTTEENLGTFSDEADISDWAIAAVNWAVGEGIAEGMTSNRFGPATLTTRAHVAALLHRYLDEDARVNSAADTGTDGSGSSSGGSSSSSSGSSSSSSSGSSSSGSRYYADNVLESVYALGFVDADGSKLSAIAVEYSVEIAASSVELADFEIQDYGTMMEPSVELGSDPGVALNVYVSATPEIDPNGVGVESGNYVIIEVNTDYQLASVCSPYAVSMAAGVRQAGTLKTTGGRTVSAGTKFVINYTTETITNRDGSTSEYYPAIDGTYFIYGIMDKYELFTQEDGTAFHATDCFDEATGELSELDLPYALYVPEDYSEDGKYMLVLHIEDAGFLGTDPMIALCESQAPANFASDEMQAYAEQQGYDGIIVVIPQIWDDIRTTRDAYTISCGVDATWQLMDYITDTYTAIDANRIYATGQSMGGMQVIAMAAQRDNYFAGILEMGCQWGTNYNKEVPNEGTVHYNIYDTDDPMITYELAENWFYAVSDDNILVTNCEGDSYSTSVWSEFAYLYYDIAGVEIPYATVSPLEQTDEEMSAVVEALVAQENETGIYWLSYTGGSHMLTWVYGHKIDASYYWLLSQTKESEDSRSKLEALNNPFAHMDAVEASEYIVGDFTHLPNGYDRLIATENSTGISYFYAVPANGAGTDGYNSAWMNRSGGTPSAGAGWNANTVYTVDSILITDSALTVTATLDANADYTVEVYAVAIGENEAELVASGILSSGADTFTSDALTAFAENVIYTVVVSDAGVVVASAMHLTLGNVLESVYALGFVDADGSKLSAIAVEYSVEIAASSVELADFEIQDYGTMMEPSVELGSDPGVALNVYVSATPEIDPNGVGVESGNYVIIEVNTDYQLASVCSPYAVSMAAGVRQAGTLKTTGGRTVSAGTKFVINYTTETITNRDGSTSEYYPAIDGTYFIYGIMDKYELFTQEDGTAFHATDCFDEATGELSELDLPYALYVPEDYSEDGKYMLVLHIEDAGFLGTDPMIALCESQAPANFASDEMQAYAEQQGYDGIIVVIPQIWDDIRTTRDAYTISCGVDATWQLMDYITDTYTAIDANRIYATGQSMGGMQVIAMAAQRDNYFAGILEMGCQWGTNYNKEVPNEGTVHYNIYDTDDPMITYELAENWFYAVSDDNILVTNCEGDSYSTSVWSEFAYLYYDIAGVEIPYATVSPLEQTDEEMSAVVEALVAQENETGIYWLSYTGGSHMLTWVYGHKIDASYYWLLSQTKESEDSRSKLEALNNPFAHMDAVEASEYIVGDFTHLPNGYDRLIATENSTGISYFYAVPANGAGTDGYNSAWMNRSGGTPSAGAGWNANTVYTVDSILITDSALTVTATLDANADYTVEVYAVAIGENEAELVASGILSSGADTFTSDALTAFAENVIYTVVVSDAGVVVASAMHLTLGEDSGGDENTAEIVSVYALGFVDTDGAKVEAIAVEYSADMSGVDVSVDSYELELNSDSTGATAVYVNDTAAISETGGSGTGKYVIIEVDTDFLMSSEQTFTSSLAVGVTQTADISAGSVTAAASETAVTNYEETQTYDSYCDTWTTTKAAIYGQYEISGIEGFQFFTSNEDYGTPDGEAYHVEDCFDEKDGLSYDIDVAYALYVPEDYDVSGSYAMVVVDNPATTEGTHPLVSVLETRSPALLASDWVQDLVKEQGLDGLIVVVPVVTARVDDNACTPAQYEALLALWDHIQGEYSIDENHVYGIGQSVGGMVLMETNRNRDNYFAAILMFENQWAQNYYKDTLFVRNQASSEETAATAPMHYPRTDAEVTWDYYFDEDGNKVYVDHDPYNLYYLISDDNIMVMNRSSNNLSNNTWQELSYLYTDLVGSNITHFTLDGNAEIAEQEALINEYLAEDASGLGLHWVTFENGTNGYSARKVLSGYEWLLSQTREDEMSRSKLDLNKPFELADEQIQTEERATSYTDTEDNTLYYLTGKAGAGTQFYNTSWLNLTTIADAAPGWLPEGMSWETGVEAAKIQSVTSIHDENGVLTAVAVEYDVDMTDAVIRLKGDEIIGLDGEVREDITIVLDPYDFYDAAGEQIECTISNVYINDSAAITADAERGSGTGCYVIVELDTDSTTDSVSLVQRMTIRTNTAIASATATVYSEVDGGNVEDILRFDAASYEIKSYDYEGETIQVRFYENVQYCANPNAPDLQVMNIYVREDMADDYTAPIFLVQRTGQMKESAASTIETDGNGNLTSMLAMLADGYVVVSPGARGQDTVVDGEYVGRGGLPMTIVDLKAAVRYLHYNQGVIPGDTEKIIAEGHSSGGGIIAVLGASGNSEYYEPYLEAIGAAPGRDDIYCCIVNSPIVDFAHIDFAYEWLFSVENVDGLFADDATSYAMSCALADEFEVWVDSLELKDPETGETIGFADGDTYTPYLIKMLNESATRFLSEMDEASRNEWLAASTNNVVNGSILTWDETSQTAEITSLEDYIGWNSGRWMKYIGCYDGGLTKTSFEMPAFSTGDDDPGHFNARMWEIIGTFEGYEEYAESAYENALTHYWSEYLINPFNFIGTDEVCDTAPVWYLRCGGHNETTANQFLNLALVLDNKTDALVDFRYSWDMQHTWISDLEIEETLAFLDEVMSDGGEETTGALKAGAGKAEMVFPQEYFEIVADDGTVSYEDGFNGQVYTFDSAYGEIVDNLCTRVLVLEDKIRVAIVAVEVAQTLDDQVAYTKKIVSEICGVDEDNVWVHCTHQFGFMHRPSDTEKAAVYDDIMKEALTAACEQAMETFQSAVLGIGIGDCYVSANKNIENPEGVTGGPYYGPGSTLETDTTLTMIRFASAETGEDIGYFMSYGTKPSALCTTGKTVGNRQVNTEVTGEACKIVEAAYSVPCLFCMPAAGDQYPRETAQYYGFDEDGNWGLIDIGFDEGIKIVERLGAEMGDVAVNVASAIECDSNDADISLAATSFDYVNKAGDADMTITCDTLVIGDIALVGFKQEMDCVTGQQIQAASPYGTTLMVSFLNGDGKYFGHREAYDFNGGIGTWETNRSPYGIGAAEKFVEVAVELLGGEVTKDEEAETVLLQSVVANMGEDNTIDDSKYDGLYEEASAEDGIKAIIAAGEFYINGFAFPATAEAAADGFTVNQSTWLSAAEYADEEAYLAAAYISVLNKGNNPYMQAAGTEYLLYDTDADGYADRIEMLYLEGIIVANYTDNGDGTYSIDRGEFPDGLAVTGDKDGRTHDADHFAAGQEGYEVKAENFDTEIQPGDVALFSYTPDGWVLQRAIPVTGVFTNGADHDSYEIDGVSYEDAMKFSRDNIIVSNRNGEFTNAQKYFGFMNNTDGLTVTLWIAPTVGETVGAPVGMTSDGSSDTYLERAIVWAQARLDAVEVSEDGSGLAAGTSYVSQAVHDELADVVASAREVLESGCYDCIKDFQVYRLYLCLNGTGDDIGASFAGFSYTGFEDSIQTAAEAVEDGSSDAESEAADSENADAEPETAETDTNSADAEPAEGNTEAESAEAEAADVEAEPDVTGETGDTEEEI